jgi:hypothetical protein
VIVQPVAKAKRIRGFDKPPQVSREAKAAFGDDDDGAAVDTKSPAQEPPPVPTRPALAVSGTDTATSERGAGEKRVNHKTDTSDHTAGDSNAHKQRRIDDGSHLTAHTDTSPPLPPPRPTSPLPPLPSSSASATPPLSAAVSTVAAATRAAITALPMYTGAPRCRHFGTPRGCTYGAFCHFSHDGGVVRVPSGGGSEGAAVVRGGGGGPPRLANGDVDEEALFETPASDDATEHLRRDMRDDLDSLARREDRQHDKERALLSAAADVLGSNSEDLKEQLDARLKETFALMKSNISAKLKEARVDAARRYTARFLEAQEKRSRASR